VGSIFTSGVTSAVSSPATSPVGSSTAGASVGAIGSTVGDGVAGVTRQADRSMLIRTVKTIVLSNQFFFINHLLNKIQE
jgi:hypothetical protein